MTPQHAIVVAIALSLFCGVIFGILLVTKVNERSSLLRSPYFLYAVPLTFVASAASIISSGRTFDVQGGSYIQDHSAVRNLTRLTSLFLLTSCLSFFASHALNKDSRGLLSARRGYIFLVLFYWICTVVSPATLSFNGQISHEYVYPLLLFLAISLISSDGAEKAARLTRDTIYVILLASFLIAAVSPNKVLDMGYKGLLPGVPRFAGLFTHPVAAAMYAQLAIILTLIFPYKSRALTRSCLLIGFVALVASQSKTVWLSSFLGAAIYAYYRVRKEFSRQPIASPLSRLIAAIGISCAMLIGITCVIGSLPESQLYLTGMVNSAQNSDLSTLTGRDLIWDITILEWEKSPLLGYGITLFDESYRRLLQMPFATHAHNQFLDSLGRGGLLSFFATAIYSAALGYISFRSAKRTRYLSVLLFAVVAVRMVTEVPLSIHRYGPEMIPHLILFGILAGMRERRTFEVSDDSSEPSKQGIN